MFLIYPLDEKNRYLTYAIRKKKPSILKGHIEALKRNGVNYLNLCFSKEKTLFFALKALEKIDIPLSIDTSNESLLGEALKTTRISLINSSYPREKSLNFYLKKARKFNTSLVVLSIQKNKTNATLEERKILIDRIVTFFKKEKFPLARLFIDVIILPYRHYPRYMHLPLVLSAYIKSKYPDVKTLAGLDNFTYQAPNTPLKNAYYALLSPLIDAFITKDFCIDFFIRNDIMATSPYSFKSCLQL